jgi:threonine dehydrogenase-like Zn-dependent dehydrogenase
MSTAAVDVVDRRRVLVAEVGQVTVVTEPAPDPAPGEVRVRTLLAGICGSDLHAVRGAHPFVPVPYHPGHEVVGVVEATGDGVDPALTGARVTVEPTLTCGACKPCRTGRENLCEHLAFLGCGHAEGAMADSFLVRADRLFGVPDDLDDTQAVLIEPLATPVHAVRLAGDLAGKAVAVVGAGTIGLLVLAAVRAHGARFVAVVDLAADKRERARRLGADSVVDGAVPDVADRVRVAAGESIDVVFDCVAVESTVRASVEMALRGGTVVVVGVPAGDIAVPLALVQDRQVRIQGAATYRTEDYVEAVALLRAGAVPAHAVVDLVHDLDDAAVAFADAASGRYGKVALRCRPGGGGRGHEDPPSRPRTGTMTP